MGIDWIERALKPGIEKRLFKGRAILITGPRQVGKTSLIRRIIESMGEEYQFLDGDDPAVRRLLDSPNTEQLRQMIGNSRLVFIDEAQRFANIGLTAKMIIDQFQEKQLILSGSSSFNLSTTMEEPLTGRKWSYEIFPVSWQEWQDHIGYLKAEQDLDNRLVFGLYPDVLTNRDDQREILRELVEVESYLYKDVLGYAGLRKPGEIQKLTQALAFQVGQVVVYQEVGQLIGLDPKTIQRYIEILEKAYVLFRVPAFSRNLRNEIKTNRKIYFYDNGIRNAVIGGLQPLQNRNDTGALWENFLMSERRKLLQYRKKNADMYFWRTSQQQEIDYVEEEDGNLSAFEFKWNPKKKARFPKTFQNNYNATSQVITRNNFREFVILQ
ncbi:MAG: ATPase [Bacteroidetes bacterium SW_11_45_7]|nr:MAG: ATPase [Bacteroidetes bacterium SW_11_45_7]